MNSIQYHAGNPDEGKDWAVFEVNPNPITGMLPLEAQQECIHIQNSIPNGIVKIYGYGEDVGPSQNYTQQVDFGDCLGAVL